MREDTAPVRMLRLRVSCIPTRPLSASETRRTTLLLASSNSYTPFYTLLLAGSGSYFCLPRPSSFNLSARAEERRQEGLVTREVCAVDARESGDFMEEVEVRA
jgi:hypothetical protein